MKKQFAYLLSLSYLSYVVQEYLLNQISHGEINYRFLAFGQ